MSEMGIVIALIAVVSIVGVTLMGGAVQDGLGSHKTSLKNDELAKLQAENAQAAIALAPNTPLVMPDPAVSTGGSAGAGNIPAGVPAGSSLGLTLGNGQYLDLGNYPVDLGQAIETAGANGTTNSLLATMESMIQQAIDNGTVSPENGNKLKALAKQGHYIADIQGKIEHDLIQGNPQNSLDYRWEIGFDRNADSMEGSAIVKFRDLLKNAQTNGALADPILNQSVSILVDQIVNIASGVENAAHVMSVNQKYSSVQEMGAVVVEQMDERDDVLGINTQKTLMDVGASATSNQKANEICQAGKKGDKCK